MEVAQQVVKMKIEDIVIGDRYRKNFDHIPELAESIKENGHLQPILIDSENKLIAGECRIKAIQHLGRNTIDTIIIPIDQIADRESIEFAENNSRKDFTVSEKIDIAIAIEKKVNELGNRQGRKSESVDNTTDKIVDGVHNLPKKGERTRDFIAKRAGFKSSRSYRDARVVMEKARPEVIEAMDNDEISITGAHRIANMPKSKQLSALNEARNYPDSDGTELLKSQNTRRTVKRKERLEIPQKSLKHQQFNIIRFAPDWSTPECEILDTPINDFTSQRIAILVIECSSVNLQRSFELLDHFSFEYAGIVTVHNPKIPHDIGREFTNNIAHHIIIGRRTGDGEVGEVIRLNTISKLPPVIARNTNDLGTTLLPIIEELFPNSEDRRIDMSSSSKRKNWICWKTSYGIGEEPEEEEIPLDQIDAFEQASTPNDETDHIEAEQLSGTAITNADLADQDADPVETHGSTSLSTEPVDSEETFEIKPKRTLKLF